MFWRMVAVVNEESPVFALTVGFKSSIPTLAVLPPPFSTCSSVMFVITENRYYKGKVIQFQNKVRFSFCVSAFTAIFLWRSDFWLPVGLLWVSDSQDLGFVPFSEMSFVPLSSSFHPPGRTLSIKLLFSADREVEPSFPAQRQPELLHRKVAAPAPGQLPLPAQLLLQR